MTIVCTSLAKNWSYNIAAGYLLWRLMVPTEVLAGPSPPNTDCQAALSTIVTQQAMLDFGTILLSPGFGGTVTVTAKNARTTSGPTLLGATFSRGEYVFTTDVPPTGPLDCSKNTPTVTLTPGQLDRVGGYTGLSTPLLLQNMDFSFKPTTPFTKFNTGVMYIGSDLVIPANAEAGSYSGTYQIDLIFQ